MLAFTGVYLVFGDYVVPIVRLFSPVRELSEDRVVQSLPDAGAESLSAEQAVALARQVFPEGELRYLGLPQEVQGVYYVALHQPGEVRASGGESQVWLDQYSGNVLRVHDWNRFTAGETFLAWLFPLHNGEAFGLTGRWIVFVAGFVHSCCMSPRCACGGGNARRIVDKMEHQRPLMNRRTWRSPVSPVVAFLSATG